MLHLYVNTDAGGGGDGSVGTPWDSIEDAINSLEASGPDARGDAVTVHYSGAAADADAGGTAVQFSIATTAARYLLFMGNNFAGKYSTSNYRLAVTGRDGLYNNVTPHLRIAYMQVQVTLTTSTTKIGIKMANANLTATDVDLRCYGNIVKGVQSGGGQVTGFENRPLNAAGHGTSKFWNNLAYDCQNGFTNDFIDGSNLGEFYNCTAADCSFGFVVAAGTNNMKCVNCLATNPSGIGFVGTFTTSGSNYNAEDDGNGAPGANSRTNQTFTFVDRANDDFHLSPSDAGALGFGLTDPASGLFLDDIDGQTRSGSWDIGADEYVAFTIDQEGFRARNDDGSETTATWKDAQDVHVDMDLNTNFRTRFIVNTAGDLGSTQFQVEYRKLGDTYWDPVPTKNTN